MRALIGSLVVSLVVGCASPVPEKEPVVGPQGEDGAVGATGTQGPKGDVGPQGPAGADGKNGIDGVSAVSVISISDAGACPNGGVKLLDQDGGSAVVCNGTNGRDGATGATGSTGLTGATGAQGVAGPQGPQGLTPSSMNLYSLDGGEVGQLVLSDMNNSRFVFVKSVQCIAMVNWNEGKIEVPNNAVLFTGPGCTGISFIPMGQTSFFPLACSSVGTNNYRTVKPVVPQMMQAQSRRAAYPLADGGVQTVCDTWTDSGLSVAVETFTMPSFSGPFSFGGN